MSPDEPAWFTVRRRLSTYERRVLATTVPGPTQVAAIVAPRLAAEEVEVMLVAAVDGANHLRGIAEVARGGIHGCGVSAREILRMALLMGASGLVLAHNHPSGDPTPSPEDVEMTRHVAVAGEIVGITLVDHVVVAGATRWRSMASLGLL